MHAPVLNRDQIREIDRRAVADFGMSSLVLTCTFVAGKPGFLAPGADAYTGEVHVLDIGAPRRLIRDVLKSG